MLRRFLVGAAAAAILLIGPGSGSSTPVATSAEAYTVCGRVFADPHAYWPSPEQTAARSPFAKGNATCASVDFLSYDDMVAGVEFLESLFPEFVEFYELERDFGDGTDCTSSTSSADLCSAGLPRQGVPNERVKSSLYILRVTDERVSDTDKKFFTFPLAIHGIERAGAEAGVRAAEDLATWAACEAGTAPAVVNCAQEGPIPHPLLETDPEASIGAGEALRRSSIWFVFANPDGWKRGDIDNGARFFQRYNGNGVDMNRDWPTIGYTFRPYTPWSEPETRAFGQVMKQIRPKWDGGIDLHGQLIDRAFSFTLLGAGEQDYTKNQRILQTVKGAWQDAEARLAWSPAIKPNDAAPDDPRLYGVQWGTVWDTIGYTTTGSLGDWINSPLGLDADGIDNEMSLSHLSNCGVGSCYLPDAEQLHVDGNKSLVYAMVNFTLQPEDTTFRVPGKVGYVMNPAVRTDDGTPTPSPVEGLDPQPAETGELTPTSDPPLTHEFLIRGGEDGFYNGGVEVKITHLNVGGIGTGSGIPNVSNGTNLVLERYRADEDNVQEDTAACATGDDDWQEVNRYYNQGSIYLQAGQAVHANGPAPGRWRVCLTGGLASQIMASGGGARLDISYSREQAWEDPGQLPYSATNMAFFDDLAEHMEPGQLEAVSVDDVLAGTADLDRFSSVVVADDAFPGFTEPVRTGPAQASQTFADPGLGTVPCAYGGGIQPVLPPTCVKDHEFDVDSDFNNQQLAVALDSDPDTADWDLYLERQSRINGDWFEVGSSTTPTGDEKVTLLTPIPGHYRARVVNWDAADSSSAKTLTVSFSNEYVGEPVPPSQRTDAERDAWGAALKRYTERGGNLVLTDGAARNLAYMGALPRSEINNFSVYAGFIGFTRDGRESSYGDPLAQNVNQPGAAEGPGFRHQTYEPVPIGYAIQDANGADFNSAPVWSVDQVAWEAAGGRTAGITTADQVTLGELELGKGVVRVVGALLPMPTEQYYHPFGLANYAVTYSGYQVLLNALQWERPLPDLTVANLEATSTRGTRSATVTATVANVGETIAGGAVVRFVVDGQTLGDRTVGPLPAGEMATVSIEWSLKGVSNGTHTLTATVDPDAAVAESDEGNNAASRDVEVRGNKVENGDFSAPGPAAWTASGDTSHDGEQVSAGPGGSWTSDPIAVDAVRTYGFAVEATGGSVVVDQLSALGEVLASAPAAASLVPALGTTHVQVRLLGGTTGTATFDDVRLWEE